LVANLDFEIRLATPDDIEQLVRLHEHFFDQTALPSHGVDFDEDRLRLWLGRCLSKGSIPHIVACDAEKVLIGWISYGLDQSFTIQPWAYLDKFYVLPSWRGSLVPRALVKLMLDCARDDGAKAFQVIVGSGSHAAPSVINLFRKFGFHVMDGAMLAKEI
jgi:L-amino acid N-acyltransferase YncA